MTVNENVSMETLITETSNNNKFTYIAPSDVQYESVSNNANLINILPLERGIGNTIGNSLRRIFLRYIPGTAIIACKIDELPSQYSNIPQCTEDMIDVLQNLKHLKLDHKNEYESITFSIKGPCKVDGLFIANELKKLNKSDIKVVDYNVHIMNITSNTTISFSLVSHKGYGYFSAEDSLSWQDNIKNVLAKFQDYIYIDSVFSPIKKCSYLVKDYYLNNGKICDKLEITLETNGLISCKDAHIYAVNFLANQARQINNIQQTETIENKNHNLEIKFNPILLELISNAGFNSTRAQNGFAALKMKYLGDLVIRNENYLSQAQSVGATTIEVIKERLKELNLELGMYVADWPVENTAELRQKYIQEITRLMMEAKHKNNQNNED